VHAAIAAFYRWSRTGVALRAIADDRQAAMAMGIDVDRHLLVVWLMTGMVSLIAGLLWRR
jgi:branched-chain amino acid transport system permease protein